MIVYMTVYSLQAIFLKNSRAHLVIASGSIEIASDFGSRVCGVEVINMEIPRRNTNSATFFFLRLESRTCSELEHVTFFKILRYSYFYGQIVVLNL